MRRMGVVAVLWCIVIASSISAAQVPPPPPPPGEPAPPPPPKFLRFEAEFQRVMPQTPLDELISDQNALRLAIGFNLGDYVSLNFNTRPVFVSTEDASGRGSGTDAPTFLFLDLIGMGLRVDVEVAPGLAGFVTGEASLTGVSVRCDTSSDPFCDPGTNTFEPHLGLHWRVGGTYAITPGELLIEASLGQTSTLPDDGTLFELGLGLVYKFGNLPQPPPAGMPPGPMYRR